MIRSSEILTGKYRFFCGGAVLFMGDGKKFRDFSAGGSQDTLPPGAAPLVTPLLQSDIDRGVIRANFVQDETTWKQRVGCKQLHQLHQLQRVRILKRVKL